MESWINGVLKAKTFAKQSPTPSRFHTKSQRNGAEQETRATIYQRADYFICLFLFSVVDFVTFRHSCASNQVNAQMKTFHGDQNEQTN